MADPQDTVDISYLRQEEPAPGQSAQSGAKPWLGILFECCNVYSRIYKNRDGSAYAGRCPKCQAEIRASVGNGGTSQRIFRAS